MLPKTLALMTRHLTEAREKQTQESQAALRPGFRCVDRILTLLSGFETQTY